MRFLPLYGIVTFDNYHSYGYTALVGVRFSKAILDRLEEDPNFDGGFPPSVVTAYRKRMQAIRAAADERAFYALKSLHFEKLKGKRDHQHSMRLNDQWRLILEFEGKASDKVAVVIDIEDYH
jgi:proteic killer suppression protein